MEVDLVLVVLNVGLYFSTWQSAKSRYFQGGSYQFPPFYFSFAVSCFSLVLSPCCGVIDLNLQ